MGQTGKPTVKMELKEDAPLENAKMTITIELERIFDPERSKNNLMMTMAAVTLADDKDQIVAEVLHGVPAHSVVRDKETGEDWVLNYGDLFTAYSKARVAFEADEDHKASQGAELKPLKDYPLYEEEDDGQV